MLHEYHVMYSVHYYPRFHITAVSLGTYYPWIRGTTLIRITYIPHREHFNVFTNIGRVIQLTEIPTVDYNNRETRKYTLGKIQSL
jgi:hypothetical protein